MSNNSLTGSLPSSLFALSALTSFTASNNMLTGSFPAPTVQGPSGLKAVNLASNSLTGLLPDTISYLSSLTYVQRWASVHSSEQEHVPARLLSGNSYRTTVILLLLQLLQLPAEAYHWQEIKCRDQYQLASGSCLFFRTCGCSMSYRYLWHVHAVSTHTLALTTYVPCARLIMWLRRPRVCPMWLQGA